MRGATRDTASSSLVCHVDSSWVTTSEREPDPERWLTLSDLKLGNTFRIGR